MVMEEDSGAGNSATLQGMCCLNPTKLPRSPERSTRQHSSASYIGEPEDHEAGHFYTAAVGYRMGMDGP